MPCTRTCSKVYRGLAERMKGDFAALANVVENIGCKDNER